MLTEILPQHCLKIIALLLGLFLFTSTASAAPSYDPKTTIVVYVHGFDAEGYYAVGVYGDDAWHQDVEKLTSVLQQPSWRDDPTAANQVAATSYYGDTPPAWYTGADHAADLNTTAGIPRYALRVAKYIEHVLARAPQAEAVNLVSASMGTEVCRYLVEYDLLGLSSDQKITRWTQIVGATTGNWAATNAPDWLHNILPSPDIDHMSYGWIDNNISDHKTMNSALYGPMLITHWIATDDGDGGLTALSGKPNDGVSLSEDEYFQGYSNSTALHRATDGTLQMPGRSYAHTTHTGIRNNSAAWAGIAAMAQNNIRVTVTLSRAKALSTGDSWLQGKGEWVFQSSVSSPLSGTPYGATEPLNHYVKKGGNPPLRHFWKNQTRYLDIVLFDQIIPPGETELHMTFWAEELDWHPKFYQVSENPWGDNKIMGSFNLVLPTTENSIRRLTNRHMDADITTTIRAVY